MAKYIPGDRLIAEAQAELVLNLKKEFMQQFGKMVVNFKKIHSSNIMVWLIASTHRKLDRLALSQLDGLESIGVPIKKDQQKPKIPMK